MAPNAHWTTPPVWLQDPWLGFAETKLTFPGTGLVRNTEEAAAGPRFVTNAVKTMFVPNPTGAGAVIPAARSVIGFAVLMFSLHPPLTVPRSPSRSSMMNKDQAPLGLVPLNADNVAPKGGAGAGGGKLSEPGSNVVGRYEPVTMVPALGSVTSASSSKVKVMALRAASPPTS